MEDFDETQKYGGFAEILLGSRAEPNSMAFCLIEGYDLWCADAVVKAMNALLEQINESIPVTHHRFIKWIVKPPPANNALSRNGAVGWKYSK